MIEEEDEDVFVNSSLRRLVAFLRVHYCSYYIICYAIWHFLLEIIPHPLLAVYFALIIHIPLTTQRIRIPIHVILFSAETLMLVSMKTSLIGYSDSILLTILHINTLIHIRNKKIGFILYGIAEIYMISQLYIGMLEFCFLALSLFSIFIISLILDYKFVDFEIQPLFLAFFIDSLFGNHIFISRLIICISLFLFKTICSYNFPPFSSENRNSFIYVFIALSFNFFAIYSGMMCQSEALIASSILSIYNNLALLSTILGDCVSRLPPTKLFSFGASRAKYISHFCRSLIILYSAYDLCFIETKSLFLPLQYTPHPWKVVSISACGFVITLLGALYFGKIRFSSFFAYASLPLLCDIFVSAAAFVSSLFDASFDMPEVDEFVTVLIIIIIFVTVFPEFISSLNLLLLETPSPTFCSRILKRLSFGSYHTDMNIWKLNSGMFVATFKAKLLENFQKQYIEDSISQHFYNKGIFDITIETV